MAATTTKAATPKAKTANAGVKKSVGRPKGSKKADLSARMVKMQAFFKENRSKYKDLDFKDQQKKLGEDWKKSPKNPKNSA